MNSFLSFSSVSVSTFHLVREREKKNKMEERRDGKEQEERIGCLSLLLRLDQVPLFWRQSLSSFLHLPILSIAKHREKEREEEHGDWKINLMFFGVRSERNIQTSISVAPNESPSLSLHVVPSTNFICKLVRRLWLDIREYT
jgi:hypothetical protein